MTVGALDMSETFGGFALILSSIFIYLLGKNLNKKNVRRVVDVDTGQKISYSTEHTFFWIKMENWAPVILSMGIILSLSKVTGGKADNFFWPLVGIILLFTIGRKFIPAFGRKENSSTVSGS